MEAPLSGAEREMTFITCEALREGNSNQMPGPLLGIGSISFHVPTISML